jgi:hypothetical protein
VVGKWSKSGCALGEAAVALDGSLPLGEAIKSEIAQRWSEVSLAGSWDEGAETRLTLATNITAQRACAQQSGPGMVTLPVQLTYATEDGRVARHAADAQINFFQANEVVIQAQLMLSETMTCARGQTKFQNLDLRCSEYARVEARILVNRYHAGASLDQMELELYEYKAANQTGAADRVERLGSMQRADNQSL